MARTIAEVEAIREFWSKWNTHRDSDIDICIEFVWRSKDFIRPHVILIYRNGALDAMLVGRLRQAHLDLKIGYLRLSSVPLRLLSFSYGGFLGRQTEQNAEALVRSVMDALRRGEGEAAYFQSRADSPLFEKGLALPGIASRDHSVSRYDYRVMQISGTVEQVYAGLSAGLRAELRRKKKKLLKDFGDGVEIQCVQKAEDLDVFVPRAEEVARKTYQRGLGVGFEDTEPMRRNLRVCAEHGWLRAYLLMINGKARAFWIGTCYEGAFYSDYLGFDPQISSYSPGTVLFTEMIEDFCRSGVKEVHFGAGDGRYKDRFGQLNLAVVWFYIFAPTWKAWLLNSVRTTILLVDSGAKEALQRIGALSTVKKAWRLKLRDSQE
ncbi:MAG: GNAT family N-acetyltransferase [Candidatus Acidiferrales bacterium]